MKKHRFVGIILINLERKVLLQLRGPDEANYPNYWTLPGGMVETNESPEQALAREVKEELDLDLHDHELFKVVVEKTRDKIIERHIYWCNITERIEDLTLGEGVALKYFSSKEIPFLKIAFGLQAIIEEFMRRFNA